MTIQTVAKFIACRMIEIFGDITDLSVDNWIGSMELMRAENYDGEIRLRFNSNGGDAVAALKLYRYLREIELAGTTTFGLVTGHCYSAAVIVLLGCTYRLSVPDGSFLLHYARPSKDSRAMGIVTATAVSYDFAKIIQQSTKLSADEISVLATQEKKFDAEAALRIGLIERIN